MTELTDKLDAIARQDLETKQDAAREILEKEKNESTLNDVYEIIKKWLGIKEIDTNRIDVILATAISNQLEGTPIWLFIVGASGDWKSAFIQSLTSLSNVILVDQLTTNTLASGQKDVQDLGSVLQNSSHILIFKDLASMTSKNKDDKCLIWGEFRTLYDGDIFKQTGSGINKKYTGCHVTIIAGTTPAIRDEILIHAQLGTRELMYDTQADVIDNDFKMDKAWENEAYETEMRQEISEIIRKFLNWHPVKKIVIPDEIKQFCKQEANRLSVLRASGAVDYVHRELINPIIPEVPTRLVKQLKRIYICLKSLDENYPDEKCRQIITHIVNSTGDKVRQMILDYLKAHFSMGFKVSDIQQELKLGRASVKIQLETLWNLGILEKEMREERVGGFYSDQYNKVIGGRVEEVAYYKYKI